MRTSFMPGRIGGLGALCLGLAVGGGLALLMRSLRRHDGGSRRYLGQAGERGEEHEYDDTVDTAADMSFPASDPPSYSAARRVGTPKHGSRR